MQSRRTSFLCAPQVAFPQQRAQGHSYCIESQRLESRAKMTMCNKNGSEAGDEGADWIRGGPMPVPVWGFAKHVIIPTPIATPCVPRPGPHYHSSDAQRKRKLVVLSLSARHLFLSAKTPDSDSHAFSALKAGRRATPFLTHEKHVIFSFTPFLSPFHA